MNKTALRHMMQNEDVLADDYDAIFGYRTSHAGLVLAGAAVESAARFASADGDYLSLPGITPAIPAAAGFTLLVRAAVTQDAPTVAFLQFRTSIGATVFYFRRVNSSGGNLLTARILDQYGADILPTSFFGEAFQVAHGVRTYLFAGSMASGNIYLYRVGGGLDAQVGSTLSWAADELGFTDGGSALGDVDRAQVGRELTTTRSDMDLQRLVFWPSYIDVTSEATRRTLCDAAGIPVATMPGTPLIDIGQPAALIHRNAGSLADFTVNGYPTQYPYQHHMVRMNSTCYLSKTTGTPVMFPDFQYATFVYKGRWDALRSRWLVDSWDTGGAASGFVVTSAGTDGNIDVHYSDTTDFLDTYTLFEAGMHHEHLNDDHTWHWAIDIPNDTATTYKDGQLYAVAPFTQKSFTANASAIDTFAVFCKADALGSGAFIGRCGLIWGLAGPTAAACITDPAKFYPGRDVDFGPDGTAYGTLPTPQLYLGGVRDAASWNINRGSGGNFTMTGTIAEVGDIADDSTPSAFTITDRTGQNLNTLVSSFSGSISGINIPAAISISGAGEFSMNGTPAGYPWGTDPALITRGERVDVRHTTASTPGTVTTSTITIGGVSETFTSTTKGYTGTLTDNADDGSETVGVSWGISSRNCGDTASDGATISAFDALFAMSFPSVAVTGTVSSAVLTLGVMEEMAAGTLRVYGESNAAAVSAQWSGANLPSGATLTTASATFSSAVGTKNVDVTAIVNEILGGAAWVSGGRMNFVCNGDTLFVHVQMATVNVGTPKPTLVITV